MKQHVAAPSVITVIRPPRGWFRIDLKELWAFRELAYFFVWRDLKVRYKQTALGALWAIFQPFVAMVVFSVFFGKLARMPSDGIPYPIFVYSGLIFWNYFSFSLSHAAGSMVENASIIKKIYFPRLIIPIASSLIGLVDFAIAALILVGLMVYYRFAPSILTLLYLPALLAITFLTALGVGSFLASMNVKYRDVRYAMPFFIQMLLFVTPVIYPVSIVGERFRWLLALNPMSSVIETVRGLMFKGGEIDVDNLLLSAGVAVVLFVCGVMYFRKTEQFFADII